MRIDDHSAARVHSEPGSGPTSCSNNNFASTSPARTSMSSSTLLQSDQDPGSQQAMQQARQADVPDETRIQEPKAGIDTDDRHERNKQPLPGPEIAPNQVPDQHQSRAVQQQVRQAQVGEMAA